jgi:acetyltransferase-like isoleucine patch superfamily enzyme
LRKNINRIRYLFQLFYCLVFYAPFLKGRSGRFIVRRPIIFTPRYCVFGKNVSVRDNCRIEGVSECQGKRYSPLIKFGNNVSIEQNLHLTCANRITIGSNTSIAANVTITDITHPYTDISMPIEKQSLEVAYVEIGENCKIYNNAVILPGVTIGKHSVVAANSVVLSGIYDDYSVIAGMPATIRKYYNHKTNKWIKNDKN